MTTTPPVRRSPDTPRPAVAQRRRWPKVVLGDVSEIPGPVNEFSRRLTGTDLTLLPAPLSGDGTSPDGQIILNVNTAELAELSTALQEDARANYVKKYPEN